MDAFLEKGELSGKIICPNKKCNAKLGNYDWAGLCCGCSGNWVVPVSVIFCVIGFYDAYRFRQGFCISRSKVDEIV